MANTESVTTAEQLLRMPRGNERRELVRGELRRMTPAGHTHGRFAARMLGLLWAHVESCRLGETYAAETGFILERDPDTVRAPDASFVGTERARSQEREDGFFVDAPDLAIEVLSPSDSFAEVEEKAFDWLRAGAKLVLLANPKRRSITAIRARDDVRVLTGEEVVDCDDVVPGWRPTVADLFGA